jgi:hypothetical protein
MFNVCAVGLISVFIVSTFSREGSEQAVRKKLEIESAISAFLVILNPYY